jgi:hypothetical protein
LEPTNVLPIAAVLSLVTVEFGGSALLGFLTGREGLSDWQKGMFRAGHAHAGVLLVLSLVYLLYLPRADFSNALEWIAGGVLLLGVLAQSGGFFLLWAWANRAPRRPAPGSREPAGSSSRRLSSCSRWA